MQRLGTFSGGSRPGRAATCPSRQTGSARRVGRRGRQRLEGFDRSFIADPLQAGELPVDLVGQRQVLAGLWRTGFHPRQWPGQTPAVCAYRKLRPRPHAGAKWPQTRYSIHASPRVIDDHEEHNRSVAIKKGSSSCQQRELAELSPSRNGGQDGYVPWACAPSRLKDWNAYENNERVTPAYTARIQVGEGDPHRPVTRSPFHWNPASSVGLTQYGFDVAKQDQDTCLPSGPQAASAVRRTRSGSCANHKAG